MTFVTHEELKDLLKDLHTHVFEEIKEKGHTVLDGEKNWHIFNVIAQLD